MSAPETERLNKEIERKAPLKDYFNRSMESIEPTVEPVGYIAVKKTERPSSATPTSRNIRRIPRAIVLAENKSNKTLDKKMVGFKQKNYLLGSRFYKKIDNKFVEFLSEKLKKDTFELKKLKKSNFEEYSKRKNVFITKNKEKWVNETLRYLETSDLLTAVSENDLNQDAKHDAMLDHLSQEKHIASLIRKAEQMEVLSRRHIKH